MVRKKSDSIADFVAELKKRNESDTLIDERLAVKLHHETISLIRADRDRVEDRMIALEESFQTDSPRYTRTVAELERLNRKLATLEADESFEFPMQKRHRAD